MGAEANILAALKLRAKTPVGSVFNTAEWAQVPLALRERAFWSAELNKVNVAAEMQNRIQTALDMVRRTKDDGTEGAFQTREKFVTEMQAITRREGLDPRGLGKSDAYGTIRDITSTPRLRLIYDHQVGSAQEFARWKAEQDPDVLDAYPAQQLIRVEARKVPRTNWPERWDEAGGTFHGGKMIALKNDPVWEKLSRFGTPWPPFDFNSGMGLRDVSRRDAEKLGIIQPGEKPKPAEQGFNAKLEASVANLSPEYRAQLKSTFGDLIAVAGDKARWIGLPPKEALAVHAYTEGGASIYRALNEGLRSGTLIPELKAHAAALDAALEKLPAVSGPVFRGEQLTAAEIAEYEAKVGGTVERPAFTSTSQDPEQSYPGNAQFEIESKSGRRIVIYSAKPEQREVIFGTGAKFRVESVDRTGDSAIIRLTEL